MIWIITGDRGVGKTTLILKKIQEMKESGRTVYGIITPPLFNDNDEKIGFSALNASTGDQWELARIDKILPGPKFGPFHFSSEGLLKVNNQMTQFLKAHKKLIFLDEIGPLELKHKDGYYPLLRFFNDAAYNQNIYLVIRPELIEEFVADYIPEQEYQIISVTSLNRDSVDFGIHN